MSSQPSVLSFRRTLWAGTLLGLAACSSDGGRSALEIDADGGTLRSADGRVTLVIPPGALARRETISITKVARRTLDPAFSDLPIGSAYALAPDGLEFMRPVTLTLRSDQRPLQDDGSSASLEALLSARGGTVEPLENLSLEVDDDANTLTLGGELRHFSPLVQLLANDLLKIEATQVPDPLEVNGVVGVQVRYVKDFKLTLSGFEYTDDSELPFGPVDEALRSPQMLRHEALVSSADIFEYTCSGPGRGRYRGRFVISVAQDPTNDPRIEALRNTRGTIGPYFVTLKKPVRCVDALPAATPGPSATPPPVPPSPSATPEPTATPSPTATSEPVPEPTPEPTPVANAAPMAADDRYTTEQDIEVFIVEAPGLFGNDSDADGDALILGGHTQPANGIVSVREDGSFSYVPDPGFSGTDTFQYFVSDGSTDSALATVTLTVTRACEEDLSDPRRGTAVIGADGGSVRSADGQLELAVSPGALDGEVRVCIDPTAPPDGFKATIGSYAITTHPSDAGGGVPAMMVFTPLDASGQGAPLVQADGSLAADAQIPVIGRADGSFGVPPDSRTLGDAASAAPVATEASLTELPETVVLPGDPAPPSDRPSLFRTAVTGARSAEVDTLETLTVLSSANTIFSVDLREASFRLRRVGEHGPAQIDFGNRDDGSFQDLSAIGDGDFVGTLDYRCRQAGVYPIALDIRVTGHPDFYKMDLDPSAPSVTLHETVLDLSLTCTAAVAVATYTAFDAAEATAAEALSLIRRVAGLSGASARLKSSHSLPSAPQGQFPVPNAGPDALPLIVATTGVGPFTGSRGPVGAIAVDAATGAVLFRYEGNEVPFFDALPLEPPSDDPSLQPDSGAFITRRLDLLGQFACGLAIQNDGTGGGACAAGINSRDASYLLGSTLGYTSVQGSPSSVRVTRYKQFSEGDPASFQDDGGLLVPSGSLPDVIETAVASADARRLLVAGGSSSGPGELWLVDRSAQDPNTGTPASATLVGTLGSNPRRMRCGDAPLSGALHLCAISDFSDNTVTPLTWDGLNPPTLGAAMAVGDGPVGVDVFEHRIVVTGFNDNSFTVLSLDPADPLNGLVDVATRALADIGEVAACTQPGHAVFVRDADRRVAISCNGSNGVAVIPGAYE